MVLQIEILNDNALGFLKNLEDLKWIILKENDSETVNSKPNKSYIQDLDTVHVLEEPEALAYGASLVKPKIEGLLPKETTERFYQKDEDDEPDFTPPCQKTDLSKLIGAFKHKITNNEVDSSLKEVDESNIIPARQKTDLSKLIGAFKHKMTNDEIDSSHKEVDESEFIPPRKKVDLTKLRGTLKLDITIDEIDSLTKSWRNEWNRDFF